jgi:hypothetical protein
MSAVSFKIAAIRNRAEMRHVAALRFAENSKHGSAETQEMRDNQGK